MLFRFFFSFLCCTVTFLYAESITLEKIIVTKKKSQNNSPSPNLKDSLTYNPQFFYIQSGGEGRQTSLFFRGTNSEHTNIYWNHILINDVSMGGANLAYFLQDEDTIQEKPFSISSSSSNISGNLFLETKQPTSLTPLLSLSASTGSFNTFHQHISLQQKKPDAHYRISFTHNESDGYNDVPPPYRSSLTQSSSFSYARNTLSGHYDMRLHETMNLSYYGKFIDGKSDYVSFLNDNSYPMTEKNQLFLHQLKGSYHSFNRTLPWDHEIIISQMTQSFDDKDLTFHTYNSSSKGTRTTLGWHQRINIVPFYAFHLSITPSHEAFSQINPSYSAYARKQFLVSMLHTFIKNLKHHFSLYHDASIPDPHTLSGKPVFCFKAIYDYHLNQDHKFSISLGHTYHIPSLSQLYYKSPFFNGNPNLKPEKSNQISSSWSLENKTIKAKITTFYYFLHDLISSDFSGLSLKNYKKAQSYGIDGQITKKFDRWISSIDLGGSLNPTKDLDHNMPLLRRPKWKSYVEFFKNDTWAGNFSLKTQWIGKRRDINRFTYQSLTMPNFILCHVSWSYPINKDAAVYFNGNNILNKSYQNPSGYKGCGATFTFGLKKNILFN